MKLFLDLSNFPGYFFWNKKCSSNFSEDILDDDNEVAYSIDSIFSGIRQQTSNQTVSKFQAIVLYSILFRKIIISKKKYLVVLRLFEEMIFNGIRPDIPMLTGMIYSFAYRRRDLRTVEKLYAMVRRNNLKPDAFMFQVLIRAYLWCGETERAFNIFQQMNKLNMISDAATKSLLIKYLNSEKRKETEIDLVKSTGISNTPPLHLRGYIWCVSSFDLARVCHIYSTCFHSFNAGDQVFVKIVPWILELYNGQRRKLSPRYIGPYEVVERVVTTETVAYRLALPSTVSSKIHHQVFPAWTLRSNVFDPSHILNIEEIELRKDLSYDVEPVEIIDKVLLIAKTEWKLFGAQTSKKKQLESAITLIRFQPLNLKNRRFLKLLVYIYILSLLLICIP